MGEWEMGERRKEKGEWAMGEGRRENGRKVMGEWAMGDGRKAKGERRREKGDGRWAMESRGIQVEG